MKKNRSKAAAFVLTLILLFSLTACGTTTRKIKYTCDDGAKLLITLESSNGFQRSPVFEVGGLTFIMKFNGIAWYEAYVIDAAERSQFSEAELCGQSSNIRIYGPDADGYYSYILDLDGTDAAYVRFDSEEGPGQGCFGNDFVTSACYEVDGLKTVPDLEWSVFADQKND